jgi:hypothetical protein
VRTNRQARLVVLVMNVTGARGDIKAPGLTGASSMPPAGGPAFRNGTSIVIEADRDI